jgi:hypothetical protein
MHRLRRSKTIKKRRVQRGGSNSDELEVFADRIRDWIQNWNDSEDHEKPFMANIDIPRYYQDDVSRLQLVFNFNGNIIKSYNEFMSVLKGLDPIKITDHSAWLQDLERKLREKTGLAREIETINPKIPSKTQSDLSFLEGPCLLWALIGADSKSSTITPKMLRNQQP